MQFDPALAAQQAFSQTEAHHELGSDWPDAAGAEETFSSNAGSTAREAYEQLLAIARRSPQAYFFQAFCIYITWQQVTEETIPHHFLTGVKLCEQFLPLASTQTPLAQHVAQIRELYQSFKAGLGADEADEHQKELDRDSFKGGD
ncbi:MAG: hypothetical protein ACT4OO_00725 [Nitrospiraceae bacterium]